MKCSQCDNKAVVMVGDAPLCVNCNLKLAQATQIRDRMLKEEENFIIGQIEAVSGMYGVVPKHNLPDPVIHHGPITLHNIKVSNSIVGAINTGEVEQIDVALSHIGLEGNVELQKKLSEFTQAVLDQRDLDLTLKNEILEQLSLLTTQVATPPAERKTGIVKAVVSGISEAVKTSTQLLGLWTALHPYLAAFLGWVK